MIPPPIVAIDNAAAQVLTPLLDEEEDPQPLPSSQFNGLFSSQEPYKSSQESDDDSDRDMEQNSAEVEVDEHAVPPLLPSPQSSQESRKSSEGGDDDRTLEQGSVETFEAEGSATHSVLPSSQLDEWFPSQESHRSSEGSDDGAFMQSFAEAYASVSPQVHQFSDDDELPSSSQESNYSDTDEEMGSSDDPVEPENKPMPSSSQDSMVCVANVRDEEDAGHSSELDDAVIGPSDNTEAQRTPVGSPRRGNGLEGSVDQPEPEDIDMATPRARSPASLQPGSETGDTDFNDYSASDDPEPMPETLSQMLRAQANQVFRPEPESDDEFDMDFSSSPTSSPQ